MAVVVIRGIATMPFTRKKSAPSSYLRKICRYFTDIQLITEISLRMEQKTEIKVAGTDKVFATHVGNVQSDEEIYGSLLDKLFTTYKAKNHDYSNAFSEMFDELGVDYAYGKLREKINRIKVLRKQPNMVENEGLEDALLDTAGYAILSLVELKKRKSNDKSE